MSEKYPKHTDEEAAAEAHAMFGVQSLVKIVALLGATAGVGWGGHTVAGISGIIYAEGAFGTITAIVYTIREVLGPNQYGERRQVSIRVKDITEFDEDDD